MTFRFTGGFPLSPEVQNKVFVPWGCTVQPFSEDEQLRAVPLDLAPVGDLARCSQCFAYVSQLCSFQRKTWRCALCGNNNSQTDRYADTRTRQKLPELRGRFNEFVVEDSAHTPLDSLPLDLRPCYVALVDLTAGRAELELIKSGLLAALEAMPASALFGMVVYSDRVGVFDLRSPTPHVKHMTIPADDLCQLGLEELLDVHRFLVPVSDCQASISTAVDSLHLLSDSHHQASSTPHRWGGSMSHSGYTVSGTEQQQAAAVEASLSDVVEHRRGLGPAVAALVDYFGLYDDPLNVRVLTFVGGAPNHSLGAVDPAGYGVKPSTSFYRDTAIRASHAGVSIDLFVVTTRYVGLASIKFLSTLTGGKVMMYDDPRDNSLPQDMFQQLSKPQALHGILRIRTSTEFRLNKAYGNLLPDAQLENLYHLEGCDVFNTVAFDFEFNSPDGFSDGSGYGPTLQLAFAYTYIGGIGEDDDVDASDSDDGDDDSGIGGGDVADGAIRQPFAKRWHSGTSHGRVQRRLRIHTVRPVVADTPQALLRSVDPEVVLCLLTHRSLRMAMDEGPLAAQAVVSSWLAKLVGVYMEAFNAVSKEQPLASTSIDLSFGKASVLAPMPRLVFGLEQSPLLSGADTMHPDTWVHQQCMLSTLEPSLLRKVFYPQLTSYSSPDQVLEQGLPLNRAAATRNPLAQILVADAHTAVTVLYGTQSDGLPYPPPRDSLVKQRIAAARSLSPVAPQVVCGRLSEAEGERLLQAVLKEDGKGSTGSVGGLKQFLEKVHNRVAEEFGLQ